MVEMVIVRRPQRFARGKLILAASALIGFAAAAASAAPLPPPDAIEKGGAQPVTLTVVEPHESEPGRPVEVAYRAFPAPVALAAALGPDWASKARAIEFRALDGYVSRIDVACSRAAGLFSPSPAPTTGRSRSTTSARTSAISPSAPTT